VIETSREPRRRRRAHDPPVSDPARHWRLPVLHETAFLRRPAVYDRGATTGNPVEQPPESPPGTAGILPPSFPVAEPPGGPFLRRCGALLRRGGTLRGGCGPLHGREGALHSPCGTLHRRWGPLRGSCGAVPRNCGTFLTVRGTVRGSRGALRGVDGALRTL